MIFRCCDIHEDTQIALLSICHVARTLGVQATITFTDKQVRLTVPPKMWQNKNAFEILMRQEAALFTDAHKRYVPRA